MPAQATLRIWQPRRTPRTGPSSQSAPCQRDLSVVAPPIVAARLEVPRLSVVDRVDIQTAREQETIEARDDAARPTQRTVER